MLRKEIQQKQKEKKQLKKEEQTLKDGYQSMLKHRKDYVKKDLETRMNQ